MKIKSIRLQRYKRFHDLTIDLVEPKRMVALIGPNGCGKSSVFDGIAFLAQAYGVEYGNRGSSLTPEYHNRYENNKASYDGVQIEFDNGFNFARMADSLNRKNKGHTLFAFRSPYRYTSKLLVTRLEAVPDASSNKYGATYSVDLDDKMTNNFQLLYAKINNYVKNNQIYYKDAVNFFLGEVNNSLKNCLNIEIDSLGEITDGKGTINFKKSDQEDPFDYNVLSSGEKEVVDMLIDIVVKKDDFNDSIFLIDEPELHINTSIQRKLLLEINRLVPPNCQIWIATHSIGFLRALEEDFPEVSQIIKFDGNYANEPVTLKPMKRTRQDFLELYKTAVDDIAELIAPKRIIYCEGEKTDQGFDEYCYNKIFNENHSETLFISSGGCSELNIYADIALMILNKAFKGVQILTLKDRDINGNSSRKAPTTLADREKYLRKNSNNRMLKRLEIENYLLDYEIIAKAYPEIAKKDYNTIVKDPLNQDLKACISTIKDLTSHKHERGFNNDVFLKSLLPFITPETNVYQELESEIF